MNIFQLRKRCIALFVKTKDLTPKQILSVPCTTCGAAIGEACELNTGQLRTELFGNIEAAPILTIGSGRPIEPLTGFDTNRSGAIPQSSHPLGFARNSLRTSTQAQLNLRVLKFFKVGEHGKLDFVVESFNLLNHTNLAALNQFYGAESSPLSTFPTANKAGIPRQVQFSIDFEFWQEPHAQQSSAYMPQPVVQHTTVTGCRDRAHKRIGVSPDWTGQEGKTL